MKSIFVAYDLHYGIGANNDLLSHNLPADLKRFKELTTGKAIIMGWNTYLSIGRPLPSRQNIVMTRSPREAIEGITFVDSLEAAYAVVESDRETFVIGGGQVYAQAMDSVDRIYATEINETFPQADIFFPVIDMTQWQEVSREHHLADERNLYDYDFVIYARR